MAKRILSFLTNPFVLTLILFVFQLSLFLFVTLHPFAVSPKDRGYYILRGQGAYTSYIRESKDGAWGIYSPYTTRPTPTVYIQQLYVLLGKIASLGSLDPVFVYMVTRIFAGAFLFGATYWLVTILLPRHIQTVALLFILGLEPGPLLSAISNVWSAPPAIFSYFPQITYLRHFGLPHHVLAEALGLLLIGQAFLFFTHQSVRRLVFIGALAVLGTVTMPAYNGVLAIAFFLPWTIWALFKRQMKRTLPVVIIVGILMAAIAIFMKLQFNTGYPWKDFNLDEKRWVTDAGVIVNYLSSLLLYMPAVLAFWIMLPRAWKTLSSSDKLWTMLATTWILVPMLCVPLAHFPWFPLANFRLVDGYAYVPMGLLAALGLGALAKAARKRWIAGLGAGFLFFLSLILTFSYTRQMTTEQRIIWMNVYPRLEEWDAIRFLDSVPKRSGVLVLKYFGEIIPSYASVRVYLGETPGAVDWDERYFEAVKFYSGLMTDTQAKNMLEREDISYIYWGENEKILLKAAALYPKLLTPVFKNPSVTIFQPDLTR